MIHFTNHGCSLVKGILRHPQTRKNASHLIGGRRLPVLLPKLAGGLDNALPRIGQAQLPDYRVCKTNS